MYVYIYILYIYIYIPISTTRNFFKRSFSLKELLNTSPSYIAKLPKFYMMLTSLFFHLCIFEVLLTATRCPTLGSH